MESCYLKINEMFLKFIFSWAIRKAYQKTIFAINEFIDSIVDLYILSYSCVEWNLPVKNVKKIRKSKIDSFY